MEYKKKTAKHSAYKKTPRKRSNKKSSPAIEKSNDIVMKPATRSNVKNQQTKSREHTGIKLIMGTKVVRQKRRLITLIAVCVLLAAVVIFSALTPTGPFEYIENTIKSFGSGSFPASVSGSELLDAYSVGSLIYTMTDTHAEVFNGSGKVLFSRQHEFNSPSLCVSSQRAAIYDRGGRDVYIYNHSDIISEVVTENDIYCADIGRNGTIAVATKSTGYASEVHVMDKNGKVKYIWYSSDETVNNVAVSNNGRRIAVSTVSVSKGEYKSKVYVFKYSSADPLYVFEYDDTIVYSIDCISRSRFTVTTDESIDFIKWKNGERKQNTNPYTLNIFRHKQNSWVISVIGNKSSSSIIAYNKSGEQISSFDFDGAVSDVTMYKNNIFVISDGYMYCFDIDGNLIADKLNVSGYSRIFAQNASTTICAGNFGLDKFNID